MTTPNEPAFDWTQWVEEPDISHIAIEDDEPVHGLYSEKQQRLLTETLYSSWDGPRTPEGVARSFVTMSNVGVFASPTEPPCVPDVLVSADVKLLPDARREKKHNTYFNWVMGKPPDVVIEIVSNREGDELGKRKVYYERMRVAYFIVWDPTKHLRERELMAYAWSPKGYIPMTNADLERLGLSLRPWDGVYEDMSDRWLRWYVGDTLLPTGAERAKSAERRVEAETQRAEAETQRAEAATQRAERLAALLRAHGLDDAE